MDDPSYRRFHREHQHLESAFGKDRFGQLAEHLARTFGTAPYLIGQSLVVLLWVTFNAVALSNTGFDPYPFILLNLAFSLQAAYAAPLILLAQTRQAERDKKWSDADARHREELSATTMTLLQQNTDITMQIRDLSMALNNLTREIHDSVIPESQG
jgi:uncharacterized membrane protein